MRINTYKIKHLKSLSNLNLKQIFLFIARFFSFSGFVIILIISLSSQEFIAVKFIDYSQLIALY